MRYGLRLCGPAGFCEYVSSTRGRMHLSDDICDLALFVQEKSALDALKEIRKNGGEPEGRWLDVIEVTFTITKNTIVPYPPKKEGFIIVGAAPRFDYEIGDAVVIDVYYGGTKKSSPSTFNSEHKRFENVERATVFKTRAEAEKRLEELKAMADGWLPHHEQQVELNEESQDSWRHRTAVGGLERAKADRAFLDTVKIVPA